jgi:hypothetical protein
MAGPITAVAAIFPLGSNKRLRVGIADADEVTVEPVVSPLGFEYAIFRAGTERIVASGTVGPDGSVVATAPLSTVPTGVTPTTVGLSDPGRVHQEEGTYLVVEGDSPSTIAHNFKVTLQDLMDINGWTLVDGRIPEFPLPVTVIALPPGWTEPDTTTGIASTTTAG